MTKRACAVVDFAGAVRRCTDSDGGCGRAVPARSNPGALQCCRRKLAVGAAKQI